MERFTCATTSVGAQLETADGSLRPVCMKVAFIRHYGKSDLASVTSRLIEAVSVNFVQLDAQVEQTSESEETLLSPEWEVKEVQFPLGWELKDIEEGEDTTSPNQEAREFASFQLKQLPRKRSSTLERFSALLVTVLAREAQ